MPPGIDRRPAALELVSSGHDSGYDCPRLDRDEFETTGQGGTHEHHHRFDTDGPQSGCLGFQGRPISPEDPGYERGPQRLQRDDRPAARPDRTPAPTRRRREGRLVRRATTSFCWPCAAAATTAPGWGPCDDGVVLDLSGLKGIEVDPGRPDGRGSAAAAPGAKSTPRPTSTAWPRRAGSSRPPASAASRWAAASGT